jgi:RNA polymerase sigma factor (TIGR02999 family)
MAGPVTEGLSQVGASKEHAAAQLLPLVYSELRQLAVARLRGEKAGHTLQATALVHEAYLRLLKRAVGTDGDAWDSRAHFFAAAAEAMRRILVENARRKRRYKRGSDKIRIAIDVASLPSTTPSFEMLEIADALTELEKEHPEHATVVKLRYFVGMTIAECADALGIATPTVERRWRYARAWLAQRLHEWS